MTPSVRIAMVGIFSALYVVFSMIPVSQFIGGPAFLTANILFPAILVMVFPFREAILIAIIGGLLAGYLPPTAFFGYLWFFLPLTGTLIGKVALRASEGDKVAGIVPIIYFSIIAWAYLRIHYMFPYWIVPHLVAGILCSLLPFLSGKIERLKDFIIAYNATMGEQSAMLMIAVYVFNLPTEVFIFAFPLMLIWERLTLGTIAGTLVAKAIRKTMVGIAIK